MIGAILLPSLTKFGIIVDFKLNQKYIAEVFCINKDKPALTCNGKCYISKHLQDVEEQEKNQAPLGERERLDVVYFFSKAVNKLLIPIAFNLRKGKISFRNTFYHLDIVSDIFHPPQFSLV